MLLPPLFLQGEAIDVDDDEAPLHPTQQGQFTVYNMPSATLFDLLPPLCVQGVDDDLQPSQQGLRQQAGGADESSVGGGQLLGAGIDELLADKVSGSGSWRMSNGALSLGDEVGTRILCPGSRKRSLSWRISVIESQGHQGQHAVYFC